MIQGMVRGTYKAAYLTGIAATGRSPGDYVRNYKSTRGMNWHRDVHDWLGGYPYESASSEGVKAHLARLGFWITHSMERPARLGLFGTGCNEYVCRRSGADA